VTKSPTVVILTGGRSRRFGRDKLTELVDGVPVVERVARAAERIGGHLVLTGPSDRREAIESSVGAEHDWLTDDGTRWPAGPGGAIAHAVERFGEGPLMILPADLPWVESAALHRFRARAESYGGSIALPAWAGGETEHLMLWLPAEPGRLDRLGPTASGELRASEFARAGRRTHLVPVGTLIDDARVFAHLTGPDDLWNPTPRGTVIRDRPDRILAGTPLRLHERAVRARETGDRETARSVFEAEARWYSAAGLPLLARHAFADRSDLDPAGARSGQSLS
jgi:molybdopterin-guanine dinucleotide biosynthesis protein A